MFNSGLAGKGRKYMPAVLGWINKFIFVSSAQQKQQTANNPAKIMLTGIHLTLANVCDMLDFWVVKNREHLPKSVL